MAAALGVAAEPAATPVIANVALDELIYHDGDRVRGRLEKREDGVFVFKSERFGVLRVSEKDATVVLATPTAPVTLSNGSALAGAPATRNGVLWYLSPLELQRRLREVFGQWNGKFLLSIDLVTDTTRRSSVSVEGQLMRKWKKDDLQLQSRYDYSETNEVTTTDLFKSSAAWRHDFTPRYFSIYRPALEWNRAYVAPTAPVAGPIVTNGNYVLFQQEIGAGVNVSQRTDRQLRVGLSENLFHVWQTEPQKKENFRAFESAFMETEWILPWRISLKDRVVLYYSFERQNFEGWENRFEVDKKLTEALSVGLRHEIRRSDDLQVQDYNLLRFFLGLDF